MFQVNDKSWVVYIIRSSDQRLYTGISNNVVKRWHAHCHLKSGAKFFRGRDPECLVYLERQDDRSCASKREAAIKALSRPQKNTLVESQKHCDWHQLLNLGPGRKH